MLLEVGCQHPHWQRAKNNRLGGFLFFVALLFFPARAVGNCGVTAKPMAYFEVNE
jgi:hypothetical protein